MWGGGCSGAESTLFQCCAVWVYTTVHLENWSQAVVKQKHHFLYSSTAKKRREASPMCWTVALLFWGLWEKRILVVSYNAHHMYISNILNYTHTTTKQLRYHLQAKQHLKNFLIENLTLLCRLLCRLWKMLGSPKWNTAKTSHKMTPASRMLYVSDPFCQSHFILRTLCVICLTPPRNLQIFDRPSLNQKNEHNNHIN